MLKRKVLVSFLMVSLFALSSMLLTACKDVNGGGVVEKENGGKATFGFQMKCETGEDDKAQVTGQVQFHDHDEKMHIHAVPDAVEWGYCSDSEEAAKLPDIVKDKKAITYSGTYTPRSKKLGPGGRFDLTVTDTDESGKDKGDTFELTLKGGVYGGYHLKGTLRSGNIKAKE